MKKKENSEIEITGEITTDAIEKLRERVLKKISADLEIDGFRKGHIPEKIIEDYVGNTKILEEIFNEALSEEYPKIVLLNNLQVIGYPTVRITKLAKGNPIKFSLTTAVMPVVTLPDYKKIAEEKRNKNKNIQTEITEEELTQAILNIRKNHAHTKHQELSPETASTPENIQEEDLAPLDDALVKKFGEFSSVDDFKEKLRAHLTIEKEHAEKERRRAALADALVADTQTEVPTLFIESELDKMIADMEAQVSRLGLSFDDYLSHVNKTREDIRTEWREKAKKRSILQLALTRIAREENIHPETGRIEREVAHILEHYKDANPEHVRAYVETLITNDLVFEFLETGEKKKKK